MNCTQANQFSIYAYLINAGFVPTKDNTNEAWFKIRNERTASMKISKKINRWFDHGSGDRIGGKLIDLIMFIHNCDTQQALTYVSGVNLQEIQPTKINDKNILKFETKVTNTSSITDRRLQNYLIERRIPLQLANCYCKQVSYKFGKYDFVTIGFLNDAGGYATRNKISKRCIGANSITTIIHHETKVILFEGFFDFLSAIVLNPLVASFSSIVLNTTANTEKCIEQIARLMPRYLYIAFDNDDAGRAATKKIKSAFPSSIDISHRYKEFKDLNEKLIQEKHA